MDSVIIMSSTIILGIVGMIWGHSRGANSSDYYGDYRGIGARILWSIIGVIAGAVAGVTLGLLIAYIPVVVAILAMVTVLFFALELLNRRVRERDYRIRHNMTTK